MTVPSTEDPRLQRLEAATLWLQRMRSGSADERIVEEWLEWCQRDPLNQQAFDDMAAMWEITGQLEHKPAPVPVATGSASSRWNRRALAASLAGVALTGVLGWWWLGAQRTAQAITRDYSSPIGRNTTYTLADGSRLELGGGTRVAVTIDTGERRVQLYEGELFVTVRSDAKRPFLVDTGSLEVMAIGTAFNVLHATGRTTVTVAEGTVEARFEDEQPVQLQQNLQLVYPHDGHPLEARQVDPAQVTAWRNMRLQNKQVPLSEVITTLNRYTPRTIEIDDAGVAALTHSGVVHIDNIDGWLEAMRIQHSLEIRELPGGRRLLAARPGKRSD
jgi:transmembrane sensor